MGRTFDGVYPAPLAFESVSCIRGESQRALDSVDVRCEPGERIAVIGPPACGKSTLLALISRLVDAAARAAQIHEEIVSFPEGYDTLVGERAFGLLDTEVTVYDRPGACVMSNNAV